MENRSFILRRLDDTWKFGLWDVDVAAPTLFLALVGVGTGSILGFAVCLGLGIAVSRCTSRLKADKHRLLALHWAHWHLPQTRMTSLKLSPPSHKRRLVG